MPTVRAHRHRQLLATLVLSLGYLFIPIGGSLAEADRPAVARDQKQAGIKPLLVLGNTQLKHSGLVVAVAFSPDGKRLASGSIDKTLKLWDAATGKETLTLKGHTELITGVAYSPDGKRIASGSIDKTLKLWDAATGKQTLTLKGHTGFVTSVAFSPDCKCIVSGSTDGTAKVWDVSGGQ